MTAHVHDPVAHAGGPHPKPPTRGRWPITASRPRWLVPGLVVAAIVGGLVVGGALPLTTVVYAGLFGGMILMHAGGHGGSHGGGGADRHQGPQDGAEDAAGLGDRSSGRPVSGAGSTTGLDERAQGESTTDTINSDDQHRPRSCH